MRSGNEVEVLERRLIEMLMDQPTAQRGDLVDALRREWPSIDAATVVEAVERGMALAVGYGSVEQLLVAEDVTEIMINGAGTVWIERRGQVVATELVVDEREIRHLISRLLDPLGLRVDRLHPMADARLPDGSRVNVVVPPLAVDGPVVTIRRFAAHLIELEAFAPAGVARALRQAVLDRRTIVVSGGTGAGKTTLLNALAQSIGPDERVITIEDTAELRLGCPHLVRLEARSANNEGLGEVTIRELVRNALRMRPDRLILGETRSAECLDLLMALTTGHRGSFTTVHANHPGGAMRRLHLLASLADVAISPSAITAILSETIDYVVHLERLGVRRAIAEVARIVPEHPLEPTTVWRAAS